MTTITCPYCLKPHPATARFCEQDGSREIPVSYLRNYRQEPPLWLATIGFTKHGKTSYLAALSLMLNPITEVWEDADVEPLGEFTVNKIKEWTRQLYAVESNGVTSGTSRILPILISMKDMPVGGSRCLVLYDIAGETFDHFTQVRESLTPILKQARTVWLFISPHDLAKDKEGHSMTNLLDAYKDSMLSAGISTEGRELIVVYTKADMLGLPAEVQDYIDSDPLKELTIRKTGRARVATIAIDNYLAKMQDISDRLEDYTRELNNGAQFISQVRRRLKMSLRFCMTSATGQAPNNDGTFPGNLTHHRVLDPLFWALQSGYSDVIKPLALVVNVNTASAADAYITSVWERLTQRYDVTTYVMGDVVPVGKPGGLLQSPIPNHDVRPRLVGPILDQLPADAKVVLLTNRDVLDEIDYCIPSWRNRILVADFSPSYSSQCDWDHVLRGQASNNPEMIINELEGLGA